MKKTDWLEVLTHKTEFNTIEEKEQRIKKTIQFAESNGNSGLKKNIINWKKELNELEALKRELKLKQILD